MARGTRDTPLDETLDGLSGVERSSYEYAWLPADHPLAAAALGEADIKPAGLWARRARVALRGAPLLMQEVFLPAAAFPKDAWVAAAALRRRIG